MREHFHVVTEAHRSRVPSVPELGLTLPKSGTCSWAIEVHGSYASVDAATHAGGLIDPAPFSGRSERGNMRGEGSFTHSGFRGFTTAAQ